jgi:hypothetical protein
MDFWVMNDAKLLNILLDGVGLGSHERVDKFRCANGHAHAFQSRYIDDAKLGVSKILFIEFTETFKRGVLIKVPEHKFASSLSADTGDVKFDFGHVQTPFESVINLRIIGETNPASTTMAGEYSHLFLYLSQGDRREKFTIRDQTKTTPAQSKKVLINKRNSVSKSPTRVMGRP